ncbi:MAG TPA: acetyl-coenzyme A synthetase, partial [Lacunisphaera sp.]|nr:acetyl-coenzyme A synthetase [Lacunisphaera sp.]
FVVLKGALPTPAVSEELRRHVAKEIGPIARPDEVRLVAALPKTRSGKIVRRLLKQVAGGEEIRGDFSTLEDISVITALQANV